MVGIRFFGDDLIFSMHDFHERGRKNHLGRLGGAGPKEESGQRKSGEKQADY